MSITIAILLGAGIPAVTQDEVVGDYLCTIVEKAGTADTHLEGSGPPEAFIDDRMPTRFKMRISLADPEKSKFHMVEIPYSGADRDQTDWHTQNSVLHSVYVGDGRSFQATEDQGFVLFGETVHANVDGDYSFNHAGLEWAGGEDSHLSVRWGRCKRV